ncbi:MAG: hypothetical protein J0L99_08940 [Chitinophagales bacterium]|nr:hypothetical protein [Chitinophagales bacterium]
MKKDIPIRKVEDLIVAVVPRMPFEEEHEFFWDAYLINLKNEPIRSVLVNSTGYGEIEGELRKTTTLRFFWETIDGMTYEKIEPVDINLLQMTSEYWISFSFEDYLYDKKYVFVPGSLDEMNFTDIPLLSRRGVMIK